MTKYKIYRKIMFSVCITTIVLGMCCISCKQNEQQVSEVEEIFLPNYRLEENNLRKKLVIKNEILSGQGGFEIPGENQNVIDPLQEASQVSTELFYTVYRVKKGDMIGNLAESFGISEDTIISANNVRQSRLLQIGQYLRIPSIPGIMYTVRKDGETLSSIAKSYKISEEKCSLVNNCALSTSLDSGTSLFLPDAKLDWVTKQEINGDLFLRPLHCRYHISSQFGWRNSPFTGSRSWHGGIDMAANTGNSIYAALAGKVTTAGWSDVYGNYVIVSHHSGYKTLYGHMSRILVSRGQYVTTATVLGKVGSTGKSTGPHLHFTVYKNGKAVNPANLWK